MTVYQLNVPALHTSFFACVFLLQFIAFVCLQLLKSAFSDQTLAAVMQAPSKDILESLRRRADEGQDLKRAELWLNDIFDKIKTLY